MKIDIEGGEFELVPALRSHLERWRPVLHLSIHTGYLPPDQREEALQELARSLEFYPYVVDPQEEWSRGSPSPLALKDLAASRFRGSLLFLPEPPGDEKPVRP